MEQRFGTCGNCGGSVVGHRGPWWGTNPPPPPECASCGAVPRVYDDTIEMSRPKFPRRQAPRGFPGSSGTYS